MLTSIPTPLCAWLTFLAQAVPNRSVLTFLELLLGAMITDRGFVTEALLAITPRRKWPTYFKWLEGPELTKRAFCSISLSENLGEESFRTVGQSDVFFVQEVRRLLHSSRVRSRVN